MSPIIDGRKVVTTAGTRVALAASSVPIRSVTITAETDNTGTIVVGGSTVVAAQGTRSGTPLAAGEDLIIVARDDGVADLADIRIDSTVSGDGVTYSAGVPA